MRRAFSAFAALLFTIALSYNAFAGVADRTLDIYWVDVEGGGASARWMSINSITTAST